MSKCDTVVPLIYTMKKRPDAVHTAAETIKKLYDQMIPELVEQVYKFSQTCLGLSVSKRRLPSRAPL